MDTRRDHRVEGVTRAGDRIGPLWLTEADARAYDRLPFDHTSNIATTTITRESSQ